MEWKINQQATKDKIKANQLKQLDDEFDDDTVTADNYVLKDITKEERTLQDIEMQTIDKQLRQKVGFKESIVEKFQQKMVQTGKLEE